MINLNNSQCNKCGLCTTRNNVVNGQGNEQAKILLVSEWPGMREDASGDILRGPVGLETYKLLAKAGINISEVFLTTTVRCIPVAPPPDLTRTPNKAEIDACADYLDQEIAAIKPNVIVPMGNLAVKRIFGKVTTLSNTRGKEFWSEKYNCKVMPIYHPMFLQRKPEYQGFTIEDLRRIHKSSTYPELTKRVFGKYKIIDTIELFDTTIKRLEEATHFSYDIETSSLDFTTGEVLSLSFSWKSFTGVTVPLTKYEKVVEDHTEIVEKPVRRKNKTTGKMESVGVRQIPKVVSVERDVYTPYWGDKQDYVISKMREAMANKALKIAHNGKFDNKFLWKRYNIIPNNFLFDTMLADFLLDENAEDMHGLKDCAWRFTEMGGYEEPLDQWFVDHEIPSTKRKYAQLPPEMLYEYAAMDVDVTMRLYDIFKPRLEADNLTILLSKLIMPLVHTLTEVEYHGVLIDKDYQQKARLAVEVQIERILTELKETVKAIDPKLENMNFKSNDQLAELFFTKLNLPIMKRTATQKPSCDEEVLTALAQQNPIANRILDYKKATSLLSKYIDGLMERVDATGALHSNFLIHGTVTGRLSSSDPNLQNIIKDIMRILAPWAGEEFFDVNIKKMFIPRPDHIWVEADYGQAEFRHWANYSQDPDMIRDILAADAGTGPDIHKKTASEAWGIPLDQVSKKLRDQAKTVVFGIMYGRGAAAVAEEIGISEGQAQQIIDNFFKRYPTAKLWLDRIVATCYSQQQVVSIFGRIRRLPGIMSHKQGVQQENERLAKNSPIQSAASDMNCNAANRIRLAFEKAGIKGGIRILVHDAIYCEIHKDDFDRGIVIMRDEMERPLPNVTVPMRAEFKTGASWGEVKAYEFKKETANV